MDYPKFAILTWIIATVVIAIFCRKAFFKIFGMPKNKYLKVEWRAFLFTAALLGAVVSIGITFLVRSFS
jgi:hypothetical protein